MKIELGVSLPYGSKPFSGKFLTARVRRKEGLGGRNFCPPSLSAAAEFRISLCEMHRLFTIFIFWCSIKVVEKEYY